MSNYTVRRTTHKDGSVTETTTFRRKTLLGTKVETKTRQIKGPTKKKKKRGLFGL